MVFQNIWIYFVCSVFLGPGGPGDRKGKNARAHDPTGGTRKGKAIPRYLQ